jgi:hypothetical protein
MLRLAAAKTRWRILTMGMYGPGWGQACLRKKGEPWNGMARISWQAVAVVLSLWPVLRTALLGRKYYPGIVGLWLAEQKVPVLK